MARRIPSQAESLAALVDMFEDCEPIADSAITQSDIQQMIADALAALVTDNGDGTVTLSLPAEDPIVICKGIY